MAFHRFRYDVRRIYFSDFDILFTASQPCVIEYRLRQVVRAFELPFEFTRIAAVIENERTCRQGRLDFMNPALDIFAILFFLLQRSLRGPDRRTRHFFHDAEIFLFRGVARFFEKLSQQIRLF